MKDLFDRYVPWKILWYFATHPTTQTYVKELARKLDISSGMCSNVLRELEKEGILERKELGKAHYYRLKGSYLTRELKRFVGLALIKESGMVEKAMDEEQKIVSIALYGSYATGDFMEKSDLDILVITNRKGMVDLPFSIKETDVVINTVQLGPGEWLKLKRSKDPFYLEVQRKHILLHGGELP